MATGLSEDEEFELLSLERERVQHQTPPTPSFAQQLPGVAAQAGQAALASSPANVTQSIMQTDPATMQRNAGAALPIVGGMLGNVPGAAAGELLRQATGTAFAPETVPQTALGRAGSVIGSAVAEDPKILKAIPGVPQVAEMAGNLAKKVGGGLAKTANVFSGGKAGDFIETAKKGLSTYGAKSKEEAGAMMGAAIKKLPGESIAPTMAETIESVVTPEAAAGNKYLVDIGKKIDNGELIDARQALKAKQAIDDVIDTIPIWQVKRRGNAFDLKRTFDDVLSSQSGALKNASNEYRAAALKDNMTKFLPVNKHGEYSRLAGMLSTLGGSIGGTIGGHEGGAKGGLIGGLAPIATAVALSPGSLGGLAAGGGSAARGLMQLGENPAVRQALLQVLQRMQQGSSAGQAPQ